MLFPELKFSYNWNNKLHCRCFTTLRLRNDAKYKAGHMFSVVAPNIAEYPVMVLDVKYFHLDQLTEGVCRIDTGYNKAETIELIKRMYKHKPIKWAHQQLAWVLLSRLKDDEVNKQEKLFK